LNVEQAVRDRYSNAAAQSEQALCCPVEYDPAYLKAIPQEILDRDYGCGDPSRYVTPGDVVLDLGSGGGKICYIAAQVVGSTGKVYGVDCNEEMLSLARRNRPVVAERLGFDNVEFRKGKIQDLQLDLDLLDNYLQQNPVQTSGDWLRVSDHAQQLRETQPLIPADSIDVIVSNCVLNLVRAEDRRNLFSEMFRVLKRGGRAVISDIVADEEVPKHLRQDAKLWSGCISGSYREDRFLEAFEEAGFHGAQILAREDSPWAVVEGVEFRSLTVRAYKGKQGPCLERNQAVIYKGPWQAVFDDDGHKLIRGQRTAVCDKTFRIYSQSPYANHVIPVPPYQEIPLDEAVDMSCHDSTVRAPHETKGEAPKLTQLPDGDCCGPEGCC
jgi:ubiquinone/menaquinone biosynthesis C-methylase UbiE